MRVERFKYFCIKNCIGTHGEVCRQKNAFNSPVVYTTDRSKAVFLV